MGRLKPWLLLAAAALIASSGAALASDRDRSRSAILKIESDMTTAKTASESVKDYDPQIVVYDMTGNTMVGRDTVRQDFAKLFASMKDAKITILSMATEVDGDVGFAYSVQHLAAKSAAGGQDIDIVLRQTDCFLDGRWLIINQHISVPFDPSTGRAVFNAH